MPKLLEPQELQRSITLGFDRIDNLRRARYQFMQAYVGSFYDNSAEGPAQPVNLIFKAISILTPHLVSKNPEWDVESHFAMYSSTAELLKLSMDDLCRKIGFKATLRDVIIDTILAMGIVRDGLAVSGQTVMDPSGMSTNLATPYADRIDLDDFTMDPMARSLMEAVFVGNRVRVTREFLEESGVFDMDQVSSLPSVGDETTGRNRREQAESLSQKRSLNGDPNSLMDYVDLVEVLLPEDRLIVTVPFGEHYTNDFLRVVEYEGPERQGDVPSLGPYHFLGFHWVPNNPFPVPPCGIWMDLHDMANDNAAKADRQARRQKEVLVYGRAAADDAQEIVDADDGESVAVDHPDLVRSVSFGGAADEVYRHLQWIKSEFGESGPGDFQQLGGEVSGADTATQANLLATAANIRVGDMKDLVYDFTASVGRNLAWYIFTDPMIEQPLKKRIPGGEDITMVLTPEAIRGDFLDYHFKVGLESMDRENPVQRSQKLIQFVQTVVPVAIQTWMQFFQIGMPQLFNFIAFINTNAKLQGINHFEAMWNDPEFQMMVMEMLAKSPIPAGAIALPGGPGGAAGGGPASPGGDGPQQGLNPFADPNASFAQSGSAPAQLGNGNLSGLPGGGLGGSSV